MIDCANYYKLIDVAALLTVTSKKFNVDFDNEKKQILLELGKSYEKLDTDLQEMKHEKTNAKMVKNIILVDGKEVELNATLIDSINYVKLRDLGAVVGFVVDYNKETSDIIVKTENLEEVKVEEKKEEKPVEKKEEKPADDLNATPEEIEAYLKSDQGKRY